MARNRMIKREFFRDEKIGALPLGARLLFLSLWIQADDKGKGMASPSLLRAETFPYDAEIKDEEVAAWLELLQKQDMVLLYEVGGQRYYWVRNFNKHQKINHPSTFQYPRPPKGVLQEFSGSAQGAGARKVKVRCQSKVKANSKAKAKAKVRADGQEGIASHRQTSSSSASDRAGGAQGESQSTLSEYNREMALSRCWDVTDNTFKDRPAFKNYDHVNEFLSVVLDVCPVHKPQSDAERMRVMSRVVDKCQQQRVPHTSGMDTNPLGPTAHAEVCGV